jgi:hypothetical protein
VATTAWDFARTLGTSAIWIAGLDLSFPDLKTHFKGALFEDRALAESTRLNPVETWSVRALRDGSPFPGLGAQGGSVLTDRRLSLYATWFEHRFKDFPALSNYRLFPEGLAISGLMNASIEELLALPVRREEIDQRLGAVFAQVDAAFQGSEAVQDRAAKYQAALGTLLGGLEQIKSLAEEAAETAEKVYRRCKNQKGKQGGFLSPQEQERIFRKLDETNKKIAESTVKDVAGFLFPPIAALEASLESPEGESFSRYLELSAKLYRSLSEAAGYNLEVLGNCLGDLGEAKKASPEGWL